MSDKMDKGAIERFAISARNKLRHSVELKMTGLGVNPSHPMKVDVVGNYVIITDPNSGIETRLTSQEDGWRNKLLVAISQNGYDNIVESVAYTWFNRLIAIRYMEVNNYLPSRVRVLSSIVPDKKEPDIVSQCLSVRLNFTDSEREQIAQLKNEELSDELFAKLFLIQCRDLNKILPELFTITKPHENMLFDISYTDPNGVVRDLVDNIPEEDFKDAVQIIGWMYQYYNTELKDDTFAKLKKNVKISKERIPSATQLFTPDWIVRYMVENSVGRTWLDGHPDDNLESNWKYYLDEAKQTPEVEAELSKLRKEKANMSPEDITVIDPCMGSGHILVYAFDVLIQIYESYGYSKEDAAVKIVEKNLYGLDIDDRAYQLAYFAVMMKARQYNSRIFDNPVKNHIFALVESDIITEEVFTGFGDNLSAKDKLKALSEIDYLVHTFRHAKTYGSLIKVREVDWTLIESFLKDHRPSLTYTTDVAERLLTVIETANILSSKYTCVVTNPPYLGAAGMNPLMTGYVNENYKSGKSDLFACFIDACHRMLKSDSYCSMITQHSFMFLASFEKIRYELIDKTNLISLCHLGPHAFDEIGGEIVQTVSFVSCSRHLNYNSQFIRLVDGNSECEKETMYLSKNRIYTKHITYFKNIPGSPFAYWVNNHFIDNFKQAVLGDTYYSGGRNKTHNNQKYTRHWWEIQNRTRWQPYAQGGQFRRWYGNILTVVDWSTEAKREYDSHGGLYNQKFSNKLGIDWTLISSTKPSFRIKNPEEHYDSGSPTIFNSNFTVDYSVLGFLNSIVAAEYLSVLNPTINMGNTYVLSLPLLDVGINKQVIEQYVAENIQLSKEDWDDYESSMNFRKSPLITNNRAPILISNACLSYLEKQTQAHNQMKNNEEKLNQLFIEIYGLSDVLRYDIEDKYISVKIISVKNAIVNLISYSVGCMFGRYSLDTPGLCYAGGVWDSSKYSLFTPDPDNIIPINDEEYFGDDIVTYFERFIETVFGNETLEENLKYIANALEIKGSGTAREKIRKYFLNDFYKDHIQMYQKCPIYWLFDSGKANGFKALIYMHRYTPDLIGKMRQNYLLKMQRIYGDQMRKENDQVRRTAIQKKLDEISRYDLAMELYASKNVSIDLDDGVKHNYALFQGIENSKSSNDKIDLLYKI